MFFQEPTKLPQELIPRILQYLSRTEQLGARSICQDLQQDIDNLGLIWKAAGAANHQDFIERMRRLPPKFRQLILSVAQYTLPFAEEIVAILALPYEGRMQALLTPEQVAAMPDAAYVHYSMSDNGVIALHEKLVTPAEIRAMPTYNHVERLMTEDDHGLKALREKLITPTQVAALPSQGYVAYLMTVHGLCMLREKLITPAKIAAMPTPGHIQNLIRADGLEALRKKLITLEEIAAMHYSHIRDFISQRLTAAHQNSCAFRP